MGVGRLPYQQKTDNLPFHTIPKSRYVLYLKVMHCIIEVELRSLW